MNRTRRLMVVSVLAGAGARAGEVTRAGSATASGAAPRPFDLQGHRGARGLAPENTLPGMRKALEIGVNTLELDLGLTRDGHLVLHHDLRLNGDITRDADGHWLPGPGPAIVDLNLAQLRKFDVGRLRPGSAYAARYPDQLGLDGVSIPTLATVFDLVRHPSARHIRLNIETKLNPLQPDISPDPDVFARAVVAAVQAAEMTQRCTVQSFDWRTLRAVQRLNPALPTVALTVQQPWLNNVADPRWTAGLELAAFNGSVPRMVKAVGARSWSPNFNNLDPALLAEARALGLAVVPWTVNELPDIERLVDWGVDGLISDHPERVRSALAARGQPLPAQIRFP